MLEQSKLVKLVSLLIFFGCHQDVKIKENPDSISSSLIILNQDNSPNKINDDSLNHIRKIEVIKNSHEKIILQDSIYEKIKHTIQGIKSKNISFVDKEIIGDCIYDFLEIDYNLYDKNEKIKPELIIKNYDKLFDSYSEKRLLQILENKGNSDISYFDHKVKITSDLNRAEYIYIGVSLNDIESEFSKFYWFHKVNNEWLFYGMTCAG